MRNGFHQIPYSKRFTWSPLQLYKCLGQIHRGIGCSCSSPHSPNVHKTKALQRPDNKHLGCGHLHGQKRATHSKLTRHSQALQRSATTQTNCRRVVFRPVDVRLVSFAGISKRWHWPINSETKIRPSSLLVLGRIFPWMLWRLGSSAWGTCKEVVLWTCCWCEDTIKNGDFPQGNTVQARGSSSPNHKEIIRLWGFQRFWTQLNEHNY